MFAPSVVHIATCGISRPFYGGVCTALRRGQLDLLLVPHWMLIFWLSVIEVSFVSRWVCLRWSASTRGLMSSGRRSGLRLESPDFIPDPEFVPFVWRRKDRDDPADDADEGQGDDPMQGVTSQPAHGGSSATSSSSAQAPVQSTSAPTGLWCSGCLW